ncbi:LysR substrate-binding domain-containing protein [Kitasatospora aureofaciens]|uniref:LysR substrate-binding domain-containing protein n=1 Tax=Kitasatospora aureofaciens TaxID=1894 RepID=UPI001C44CB69|nr:LysR substrate-binding domain-containing protein [Kitasatospora aureofaciens]MBV6699717.1 LysR family transcriptional regulator [Kitasatospora aureofaciens]
MQKLDPRLLAALEAVVRHGSFNSAARELGYTAPAVSQQIAELERRTGLRVLERRPVRPTPAGEVLLGAEQGVRSVLAAASAELDAIRAGTAGQIRLGAFASAATGIVPKALAQLHRAYPDVQVSLSQLEPEAGYSRLKRGDMDLALTYDYDFIPMPPPRTLRRTLVARDPVVAVVPAGHHLADRDVIDLADLAAETWIAAPEAALRLELLAQIAQTPGFRARLQYDGDDFNTVLGFVAAGLCVAVMPKLALPPGATEVVARPLADPQLTRFIYAVRIDTRHTPRALLALEQMLTAQALAAVS